MATAEPAPGIHNAPTIQIQEPLGRSTSRDGYGSSGVAHGIYSMRNHSANSFPLDRSRSRSFSRASTVRRTNTDWDAESGVQQEGDFKKKQVFHGAQLLWLAYQSIGVIYGDIGTSPLYVYSSTFSSVPSYDDLLGACSLVLWSMSIMVTFKYVLIILRADNEGEGGTFSTYSLLSRYANITNRDPREASLVKMQRFKTSDLRQSTRTLRHKIENSHFARGLLKTIGVLAVSMVMSDGVLTPAQSVLGAVQGLNVVVPNITNATIVGTTCGILILLYLIQPFGIEKLGATFAPIIILWLGFIGSFGIYNLVKYDYTVLKAFSPYFAFSYLIRNKTAGWRSLGGILLSFTGVEALFADLGAFSMRAIQISWLCWCYPCLLLTYTGQAAYISVHPDAYTNPVFNSAPPGMLIPTLIVAILAAIVASQAIITATFQLITQIMKLSYFPQIKVVHTSKVFHGQVFVPLLNWLMMVGTVLIAAIYNNTVSLGNAYGVCVIFVTFFDTCMVSLAALIVWRFHPLLVFVPWLIFSLHDATYLSSALTKVPDGAWFTLTLAAILAALFILWRFGKENQWAAEAADRFKLSTLINQRKDDSTLRLTDRFGGGELTPIRGFGIFFDKTGEKTPHVFTQFLSKLVAVPECMVFFHLRPLETPSVPIEERFTVSRLGIPGAYRLVVRHGYMDEVITPNLASLVFEQVRDFVVRKGDNRKRIEREDEHDEKEKAAIALEGANSRTESSESSDDANAEETTVDPAAKTTTTTTNDTTDPAPGMLSPQSTGNMLSPRPRSITLSLRDSHDAGSQTPTENNTTTIKTEGLSEPLDEQTATELRHIEHAFNTQSLYIIGKESLRIKDETSFFRKVILKFFLFLRENTRTKIANLRVPTEKVVEVGFVKEM